MASAVGSLEKKFFDLVVQPRKEKEDIKPGPSIEKKADRPDKRRKLLHRSKPVEARKPVQINKEEKSSNPETTGIIKDTPLQIFLTPNPSTTILQCRVEREVKDAQRSQFLMQQLLKASTKAEEPRDGESKLGEEAVKVPQVIELGLASVFELIREFSADHKELCCKALNALLNMLQGQKLEGLKNEPEQVLENLFKILMDMSRLPADNVGNDVEDDADQISKTSLPGIGPLKPAEDVSNSIASLASSCLLSLVFAWGSTGKMLAVATSFIADCANQKQALLLKIPSSFVELQNIVTAALLGKDHLPMTYRNGINQSSQFKSWPLKVSEEDTCIRSVKCDGSFLYCLLLDGQLVKFGTGYNATVEGQVYNQRSIFDLEGCSKLSSNEPCQLLFFNGNVYLLTNQNSLYSIDRDTLKEKLVCSLPKFSGVWLGNVDGISCLLKSKQQESYKLINYKLEGSGHLAVQSSLKIFPTRKHLLSIGSNLGYNAINPSTSNRDEIVQVGVGKEFSISRNASGSVFYAGKSEQLGFSKNRNKKAVNPEPLPITGTAKISHIAVAPDGDHAILLSDAGVTFFVGTSKRGEDGEQVKGRRQAQPHKKPKIMKSMLGKNVVGACCNALTSALVTKDGKLYLFGKDSTQADSKTGLVSLLNNVHVKACELGKAHVVVLSSDGRIWTAGVNNKGQCGRQEVTTSMAQRIAEVEQERDVSMNDEKSMDDLPIPGDLSGNAPVAFICSPHKHKWRRENCMICAVCNECTGYGASCVNASLAGRYPGTPCGCGAGCSGCSKCLCCRTCAGEADVLQTDKNKDKPYPKMEAKSDHSTFFLRTLATFYQHNRKAKPSNSDSHKSSQKATSARNNAEILKEANKMALLPLQQIKIEKGRQAVQIRCGAHHTLVLMDDGNVFGFGQNSHGQLGLNDAINRDILTRVPLPDKIQQVAAGSHHSLFLSTSGIVYGCGSNDKNQLGSDIPCLDFPDILSPVKILKLQQSAEGISPRVSWISASHTSTFVEYEEVLLSYDQLQTAQLFTDTSCLAISYRSLDPSHANDKAYNTLLIDKQTGGCRLLDGKSGIGLCEDDLVCVDHSHNVLWKINSASLTATSFLLSGLEASTLSGLAPHSPELSIPLQAGALTTRTQAALNLISCIDTLVTRCPNGISASAGESPGSENMNSIAKKTKESHTADEYTIVNRFKSHGGGWGYSVHSTEAIRFMCDADVLLGGVGVFGGRGEYSVIVRVYEEVGESDAQGEGELLVETERTPYECGFREKFHVLFDEAIAITATHWYTVTAKISGPSSDCGSHGEPSVSTSDNVKFVFRRSKRSNNGTDVSAGQIPELLYSMPIVMATVESTCNAPLINVVPVEKISKDFYMNFNQTVFETLPFILEWSQTSLFMDISSKAARFELDQDEVHIDSSAERREQAASNIIRCLSFVFSSCLRLLRNAIVSCLATEGKEKYKSNNLTSQFTSLIEGILTDGELDAALDDAKHMTPEDQHLVISSAVSVVTECHTIMMECLDLLHPSPPQKWNYLYQALENYNTASSKSRGRASRLLIVVLDALAQSSINLVQCLPLFPRTFSNLASIASAAQSPVLDTDTPGPASTPLLSRTAGFYEVTNLLVEIACSPAKLHANLERDAAPLEYSDSPYSKFVLEPSKALVTSASRFLVTLTSDLAYTACDTVKSFDEERTKSRQLVYKVHRFEKASAERSWNTGNGSPDAVAFSVDTDGIRIAGFGLFGGGKQEHRYELELLEQIISGGAKSGIRWDTLDLVKGSFSSNDCGADHVTHIRLNKPVLIKKSKIYAVCLHNNGDQTYCGEQGQASVKGEDGTTFSFSHCSQCSNGSSVSRGQFPLVLYQRASQDDDLPSSPSDKWVGTATTPAKATQAYQRHALNNIALVTETAVDVFNSLIAIAGDLPVGNEGENRGTPKKSEQKEDDLLDEEDPAYDLKEEISECAKKILSSEMVSYLLPQLFSEIGVLVSRNAHCAVEIMDLVRDLLPPLLEMRKFADFFPGQSRPTPSPVSYTVTVESSHPYKLATVCNYKASFPKSVKWMVLQFSPKCQTSQKEDFLQLFLVDPHKDSKRESPGSASPAAMSGTYPILPRMYQDQNWPQNALLLPGREVIFSLKTASDYVNNKDLKPSIYYGFSCLVTGYEDVPRSDTSENLVNKLVNISGTCAVNLMTVHDQLWEEDPETYESTASTLDKVEHLKMIESSASVTIRQHAPLFLPGLHLNSFPGASEALSGSLPINDCSKEKKFLLDFVAATPDTSGGRLARWLQPDSYVDPKQCLLQFNAQSLFHTLPTAVTIVTKDQYGNAVHVPTLKVELSAKPQPATHYLPSSISANLDASPSDASPSFDAHYEPTKHRDSRYHSITMMRAYKKFSFEELRLAYPVKRPLKTENILVASVGDGIYRATWIPSCATAYVLQVTLDQQLKGPRQLVEVAEAPRGSTERPQPTASGSRPQTAASRLLKFATKNSRGLRIRSNPTLQSPQVGMLEFGDIVEYVEDIRNSDGNWVKLAADSVTRYCKQTPRVPEAWCISYHKHNGRTFLVPVEDKSKCSDEVDHRTGAEPALQQVASTSHSDDRPSTSSFPDPQSPFNMPAEPSAVAVPSPSAFAPSPFAMKPPATDDIDWFEKVPGLYRLVKCGSSGHNVRYKPSLKAAPVGRLLPGSSFTAVKVVRNKSGIWLLLHETDAAKYCEDAQDPRHSWTLAAQSDGTVYIQTSERKIKPNALLTSSRSPALNMNALISQDGAISRSSYRASQLAKMSSPFNSAPTGGRDSDVINLLVASPPQVAVATPRKKETSARPRPAPKVVDKVKGHQRSSSDSSIVMKHKGGKGSAKDSSRGRSRISSSLCDPARSHSSPSARRSSNGKSKPLLPAKNPESPDPMKSGKESKKKKNSSRSKEEHAMADRLRYLAPPGKRASKSSSSKEQEKAPPLSKVIRGGRKSSSSPSSKEALVAPASSHASSHDDDIPFIDDVMDAEGNILLSPGAVPEDETSFVGRDGPAAAIRAQTSKAPDFEMLASNVNTNATKKANVEKLQKRENAGAPALSPLVAESSRSVFAAFLWHEGIAQDAMACAFYLKFHEVPRSQIMSYIQQGNLKRDATVTDFNETDLDEVLQSGDSRPPDTLVYLALFWDKLSDVVTKIAVRNQNLPPPTPVNHNLNSGSGTPPPNKPLKQSVSEMAVAGAEMMAKVPPLKRKALPLKCHLGMRKNVGQDHLYFNLLPPPQQLQQQQQRAINGASEGAIDFKDTMCDLCDELRPYPVTYHMKQAHPGCGDFAGGLGYNSSGQYCGGWAGDCGDGGVGGSTWYLLCASCREKYMSSKASSSTPDKNGDVTKSAGDWKQQFQKLLSQPSSAQQIMKNNSLFLLDLVSSSNGPPCVDVTRQGRKNTGSQKGDGASSLARWDNTSALPRSTYSHCPFPSIPCSYLHRIGRDVIAVPTSQNIGATFRSTPEYRNRSLSSQVTPTSGMFKGIVQRLSLTPEASPQKSEARMFFRRSRLMRSVSTGSHPSEKKSKLKTSDDPSQGENSHPVHHPSSSMLKLMNACENNNMAGELVSQSAVLSFVTQRHDLKSLHVTLQMTLRRAALRVYVLQALTWLLRTVTSENSIHDILWYFVSALASARSSEKKNESKTPENENESTDEDIEETKALCLHPVKHMALAGIDSILPLVEAFHGFLQTVSDIMMHLPANSPVQLMAIRCWSLRVLPSDHQFLHESQVFSHISQILSKVDLKVTGEDVTPPPKKLVKVTPKSSSYVPVAKAPSSNQAEVKASQDLTSKFHIVTSSHAAIANSLTDGSTETFWESGEEDKNKPKSITVDLASDCEGQKKENANLNVEDVFLHIDNTRDVQKKVMSVAFWHFADDDDWKKVESQELNAQYVGWVHFVIDAGVTKFKLELRGPDNGLRVRQIKVLGQNAEDGPRFLPQFPAKLLQAKICEAELLKVFKLLTAEVFGQLLAEEPPSGVTPTLQDSLEVAPDATKDDAQTPTTTATTSGITPSTPRDVDPNLREHMVGILFSRSKLTSLQKKVFDHTVQAIHTEASHIRNFWQLGLDQPPSSSPQAAKQHVMDSYCFELLSMILALTGSDVGRHYVAQQSTLVQDFFSLLHTGSPRIQRQVTLLLRRILTEVTPARLGTILDARVPTQEKLAESLPGTPTSSLTSSPEGPEPEQRFGILDPLLICIAKSLSVQVKRGAPLDPAPASGEASSSSSKANPKRTKSTAMASVFSQKSLQDGKFWWLQGTMEDKSIIEAVMKLLVDMSKNQINAAWSNAARCAVSESILSLTRLSDAEREVDACLGNSVLWRSLAALCVLNHDHVEKLSSAKSHQNKNKLTCDNHDDGVTPAIIQCNECGNLCAECDRYLHLHRRTANHQRQVFKEEEEAIRVDLHEGCGRIKLFWFMALADSHTLKAMVEFKSRTTAQLQHISSDVCRFCGNPAEGGQLSITSTCRDPTCQKYATTVCSKTLICGHPCGGVKDEESCLLCLHPSCSPDLNQDADDMCMICFTDALSAAPSIQLKCGHIFHHHCCLTQLQKQWTGPRITFRFMLCSICKGEISHPSLETYLIPLRDLMAEVNRKALQRLEYEGLKECESITTLGGKFFGDPVGFALNKYAYYMCHKCNKAYYGGEVRCDIEADGDLFDPKELICGACSDVSCAQICPKHGTDFLEYKCRYCCSVAVYFCFGTTHFCQPCHDDFQRITGLPKAELPHCPAGHKAKQLEGTECPLHVQHPPTGEEFALGCGVCRNAHTF